MRGTCSLDGEVIDLDHVACWLFEHSIASEANCIGAYHFVQQLRRPCHGLSGIGRVPSAVRRRFRLGGPI